MNPHDHPTALLDLQDSVFELSDFQFQMMLAGAMARLDTEDENEGWNRVRCALERLDKARDLGFYTDRRWCAEHATMGRLEKLLERLPE